MTYKCRVCGVNEVDQPGGICEICAIGEDPYASAMQGNTQKSQTFVDTTADYGSAYSSGKGKSRKVLLGGGASITNTDPYGNSIVPQDDDQPAVQVYHAGQVPVTQQDGTVVDTSTATASTKKASKNDPVTAGITKNISIDKQKRIFLEKWFRTMFSGAPFPLDDDVTMFQVFPDYTGTSLNAMGNACDQVIVYGKLNAGAVSENNEVEVYGRRDSNNNIVATTIKNKASGTMIRPDRVIPAGVVWAITMFVLLMIFGVLAGVGVEGIVWVAVVVLCLTNLPLVLKILAVMFGFFFTLFKK